MTGSADVRVGLENNVASQETISVDIRFYGMTRDVVGEARLTVRLPAGSTVADLLNYLIDRFGDRLRERLIDGPGRLSRFVEVIVNGCQVGHTALDTQLARSEMRTAAVNVLVLPPSAGG